MVTTSCRNNKKNLSINCRETDSEIKHELARNGACLLLFLRVQKIQKGVAGSELLYACVGGCTAQVQLQEYSDAACLLCLLACLLAVCLVFCLPQHGLDWVFADGRDDARPIPRLGPLSSTSNHSAACGRTNARRAIQSSHPLPRVLDPRELIKIASKQSKAKQASAQSPMRLAIWPGTAALLGMLLQQQTRRTRRPFSTRGIHGGRGRGIVLMCQRKSGKRRGECSCRKEKIKI